MRWQGTIFFTREEGVCFDPQHNCADNAQNMPVPKHDDETVNTTRNLLGVPKHFPSNFQTNTHLQNQKFSSQLPLLNNPISRCLPTRLSTKKKKKNYLGSTNPRPRNLHTDRRTNTMYNGAAAYLISNPRRRAWKETGKPNFRVWLSSRSVREVSKRKQYILAGFLGNAYEASEDAHFACMFRDQVSGWVLGTGLIRGRFDIANNRGPCWLISRWIKLRLKSKSVRTIFF